VTRWPPGQGDLLADQRLPAPKPTYSQSIPNSSVRLERILRAKSAPMGPGAHRDDPATSHAAADAKREARSLAMDQAEALAYVRSYPGRTCPELAKIAHAEDVQFDADNGTSQASAQGVEWWRQKLGRRLSELARAGLIRRDGERDGCGVWWPA